MDKLFQDLQFVRVYLDDILVISINTQEYLEHLQIVLERLKMADLTINVEKSKFFKTKIKYLGFMLSEKGLQPISKKVDAILQIESPKNKRGVKKIIGLFQYYHQHVHGLSHLMGPISLMSSTKEKFYWTKEHEEALCKMKQLLAKQTLLHYPDFSKTFEIYTDTSDLQMGSVII